MRKKLVQTILGVALSFSIFQCQQEKKSPFPSIESTKPLEVAVPRAIEIADSYLDLNNDAAARKKLRAASKTDTGPRKVKRTRTLKDDAGSDLMHVIEYEGESKESRGFVIVAADRRVTPILAMGDTGTFHTDNPGVQIWISHVMDQVNQGKKQLKKPEKDIDALWRDFENRADIKAGRISGEPDPHLPPGRNCPDNWDAFVPPILSTQWGQGRGYNRYCPSRSCAEADDCNKAPAGCGAIAIAQVWNAPNLRLPANLPP